MRPIILRNVPQQSRIAVRVDEVATEDVPGWTNIGVSAAKLSGVALVDEKVEHARSLLELVANRHRVLVLLRAEAIGFVEDQRSEEHTSELQSLMRISSAVFCLKKKKNYY